MDHQAELRRCMVDLDVAAVESLWASIFPHFPRPASQHETFVMLHSARTQADSVPARLRAYSHRWLCERGYPSQLPDRLRPQAERWYPRVVEAVGISVNFRSPEMQPVAETVQAAMVDAVLTTMADGVKDPAVMGDNMRRAKVAALRRMVG